MSYVQNVNPDLEYVNLDPIYTGHSTVPVGTGKVNTVRQLAQVLICTITNGTVPVYRYLSSYRYRQIT
jgi:hypothetical protein